MSDTLPGVVTSFKRLTDSGILFQGVESHPVFMEPCAVSCDQFETFVDSLVGYSREDLDLFASDLSNVYSRLLDSGFFDGYLGLHFDVDRVTSYVTVVSHANYEFDMHLARLLCPQQRAQFVQSYTDRIDRITKLREFTSEDVRTRENSRYFCLSSVLDEARRHAVQMKQTRPNPGGANLGASDFGIPGTGRSLLNRRT